MIHVDWLKSLFSSLSHFFEKVHFQPILVKCFFYKKNIGNPENNISKIFSPKKEFFIFWIKNDLKKEFPNIFSADRRLHRNKILRFLVDFWAIERDRLSLTQKITMGLFFLDRILNSCQLGLELHWDQIGRFWFEFPGSFPHWNHLPATFKWS